MYTAIEQQPHHCTNCHHFTANNHHHNHHDTAHAAPAMCRLSPLTALLCVATLLVAGAAGFAPLEDHVAALEHAAEHGTRVFIAINADCETAKRMAPAIAKSWYREGQPARSYVTARLVVGNSADGGRLSSCTGDHDLERSLITYVPWCEDSYPPVAKVLCMWEWIRTTWRDSYTHFMKIDADTHLNLDNLLILLRSMPKNKQLFAGARGFGRGADNGKVPPFCLGPAYVVTRAMLDALPKTMGNPNGPSMPPNSDRAFSLVVQRQTNITCMDNVPVQFKWVFMNRYWEIATNGTIVRKAVTEDGQMVLPLPRGDGGFFSSFVRAVSVHPLKTPEDMLEFDKRARRLRLPLFTIPPPVPEEVAKLVSPLCVHNPARQYELCGLSLRECPVLMPRAKPRTLDSISTHVIYLPSRPTSVMRATNLTRWLDVFGFEARMFAGVDGPDTLADAAKLTSPLSAAEIGVRESYKSLLADILRGNGDGLHLFLEDDAQLSPNFAEGLSRRLRSPRCGGYLRVAPGGALLLGGTVWRNGTYPKLSTHTSGWKQIDDEMKRHGGDNKLCYNVAAATEGTFAWLADTATLRLVYSWLVNPSYADRPASQMWTQLAEAGVSVRALLPPLVIPEVEDSITHTGAKFTDMQARARIHRWSFQ